MPRETLLEAIPQQCWARIGLYHTHAAASMRAQTNSRLRDCVYEGVNVYGNARVLNSLLPLFSIPARSPPGRWEAPGRGCVPWTVCSVQIRALQQQLRAPSCSALPRHGRFELGGFRVGPGIGRGVFKRQRWGNWGIRHRRWRQHTAADCLHRRKKCHRNAFERVLQTQRKRIVTTLWNLLLKSATNLSHSV